MENFPVHFCPNCGRHQSVTSFSPAFVVCFACDHRDGDPGRTLFGRAEWDASGRPEVMLRCVRTLGFPTSPRKLRLMGCALTRRLFAEADWDEWQRHALACAEEWADADVMPREAVGLCRFLEGRRRHALDAFLAACVSERVVAARWPAEADDADAAGAAREVFANPFVARVWQPDWRTSTVCDLARHIYAAREFATLPILADALQDAGCSDAEVLNHCRGERQHARGCWVLDALLGKS